MNIMLYLTVLLTVTLSSCSLFRNYHRLIDQKEKFIWIGSDSTKSYLLTIDSVNYLHFTGKIIIDYQDTLYLSGFEKGSVHPTSVTQLKKDTIEPPHSGFIFIRTTGYRADSIIIRNDRSDTMPLLPIQLVLYKTPKSNQKKSKKLR